MPRGRPKGKPKRHWFVRECETKVNGTRYYAYGHFDGETKFIGTFDSTPKLETALDLWMIDGKITQQPPLTRKGMWHPRKK